MLGDSANPVSDIEQLRFGKLDSHRVRLAGSVTLANQQHGLRSTWPVRQIFTANKESWRNAKHKQQWENTLKAYVYPVIGELPVAEIDAPYVLKVLEPIWR